MLVQWRLRDEKASESVDKISHVWWVGGCSEAEGSAAAAREKGEEGKVGAERDFDQAGWEEHNVLNQRNFLSLQEFSRSTKMS
jgi:hypothetical protein